MVEDYLNDRFTKDETPDENSGVFIDKKANDWIEEAKKRPVPLELFGSLWFQSELCILFADSNAGKSILAVQIAQAIASGKKYILGINQSAPNQPVIYFDFELSDKQLEKRYSIDFTSHFEFHSNLIRVEINRHSELPEGKTFEECVSAAIEGLILKYQSKVVIIDNITYLKTDNEKAKDALALMKELNRVKKAHDVSMLILAHTPKRDLSRPITQNDLQGSKMLFNFCDSAFAIGKSSRDSSLRYIKQLKVRSAEEMYGGDNVITCTLVKPGNFLMFELIGFDFEKSHLKEITQDDREVKIALVKKLAEEGKSQREIASEVEISVGAVNKYLKL
ncbi:MAG: AAA family ATPase [Bacteroidia bacterium]